MTEWEFVGEVKEWIAIALIHNSQLPFSSAKLEQRGAGSNKLRDLTLLDTNGIAVVTAYFQDRSKRLAELVSERVSDAEAHEKIMALLAERFRAKLIRAGNLRNDSALAAPSAR